MNLVYANPSSRGKPLPEVDSIGDMSLAHWVGDAQEMTILLPERVKHVGYHAFPGNATFRTDSTETVFTVREGNNVWKYRLLDDAGEQQRRSAALVFWEPSDPTQVPAILTAPSELDGHPLRFLDDNAFNTSESGIKTRFCLVIPEGVTDCAGDPFLCCHDAMGIVLPSTFVGDLEGCFYHVGADILVTEGNPAYEVQNGFLIDTRTDTVVYAGNSAHGTHLPAVRRYGSLSLNNYTTDSGVITFPEGVEEIGPNVMYAADEGTHMVLPRSLRDLEPYTFYCACIAGIDIPEQITSIPEGCFIECFWDTPVVLPEHIAFVGYNAFDEEADVTALNPECHFETEAEYIERTGEEAFYW